MFRFRRRRKVMDEHVEAARAEVDRSRRALERTRAEVVAPLAQWRERNHFGELIRASLLEGRNGH
jgi:hypothetical protein